MEKTGHGKGIHLGIIPDGSRRWARMKGIKNYDGRQSGETMEKILEHILENHPEVNELSIWALSTENLERAEGDKRLVYKILRTYMNEMMKSPIIQEKDIKVNVVGSRWREIPSEIMTLAQNVISETKDHKGRTLNICIGYGGREEILTAVMATSKWLRKNPLIKKLHENIFEQFLLIPKPLDIMIRTGREKRLSGFMLYQIEYAELFFTDTLWPDFSPEELDKIMEEFSERGRRFGK